MRKLLYLFLILLPVFMSCGESPTEEEKIPDQISRWPSLTRAIDTLYADLTSHQTGGINAVIYKGEVLHLKGYGAANREFGVPWTPETKYLLASVTKSITASAILALVDRGLISFDDPLPKYLPDFLEFDTPLTIRHLLSMTSGLWQDEALVPLSGVTGSVNLDTLYSISKNQKELEYPPGSTFRYTDTNFRLLARIITSLTDSGDYSEALKQLLFDPLGMGSSSAPPDYWLVQENQAITYLTMPGPDSPTMLLDIHLPVSGDGGVRTTMRDFIRWLLYMREGIDRGECRWQRLNQVVHLADGTESPYRLGVSLFKHRGLQGLSHGGLTGTQYIFFPEIDLIVTYFHNDLGTLDRLGLARALIDAFLMSDEYDHSKLAQDKDWEKTAGTPPDSVPYADVSQFVGHYIEPEDGLILVLSESPPGQLQASYKGSASYALITTDGSRFKTPVANGAPGIEVGVAKTDKGPPAAVGVKEIYWDKARSFMRVTAMDAYDRSASDIEGFYYSEALDVFFSVRFEDNRYVLRIGSGAGPTQKFRLAQLQDSTYEAHALDATFYDKLLGLGRFGVKFDIDKDSRITGLRIITDRVRKLNFQKVHGLPYRTSQS